MTETLSPEYKIFINLLIFQFSIFKLFESAGHFTHFYQLPDFGASRYFLESLFLFNVFGGRSLAISLFPKARQNAGALHPLGKLADKPQIIIVAAFCYFNIRRHM